MQKIPRYFAQTYKRMISSIAFIPTIIILASLLLGVFVFYFEDYKYTRWLSKNLEFVLVSGADNARMVLTTVIGGIISLTVFSFSMVMVVLNRTSDALSPRLLPQLVAKKFHQVVLGFYMGTIVYSLILVISIEPEKNLPALGILISMVLAVSSLGLFIYFIHSISESIQVNNIMRGMLRSTARQLDDLKKKCSNEIAVKGLGQGNGHQILATETGYFFHSSPKTIVEFLQNNNIKLRMEAFQGEFLTEGSLLAVYYAEKQDEESIKAVHNFFYSSLYPDDREQYFDSFRKISEIALKALSPGINDPGTALIAIRFLTILFEKATSLPEYNAYYLNSSDLYLLEKLPSLDCLLTDCITPIRQCAGSFTEILTGLLLFFEALLKRTPVASHPILLEHIQGVVQAADETLQNPSDRNLINRAIEKIKQFEFQHHEEIPELKQ